MGKKLNFIFGAFVGAAAGAVAGIMLAPRAGAESRAMAADAMNDAWDTAVDSYERGSQVITSKVSDAAAASGISADELREKVDAARARMDQLRSSLSDAVANASAQVVDVVNTVSDQVASMADAAEDHRASSDHAPRTIYGRIVAEADRIIDGETIVRRALQYGLKHEPGLDREGQYRRLMEHMHEKYDYGGYLQLWIPESDNAKQLEAFRQTLANEEAFRRLFDTIYDCLHT